MVGGLGQAVDAHAFEPGNQVLGHEYIVAAVRRFAFGGLVDAERGRMRLAGMARLPGPDEARRGLRSEGLLHFPAKRILRRHVEIAAYDRARRARIGFEDARVLVPEL